MLSIMYKLTHVKRVMLLLNISNGYQVIWRTRLRDGQTDGQTDGRKGSTTSDRRPNLTRDTIWESDKTH